MAEAAEVRGKGRFVSHNIICIIKCGFGSNADSIFVFQGTSSTLRSWRKATHQTVLNNSTRVNFKHQHLSEIYLSSCVR